MGPVLQLFPCQDANELMIVIVEAGKELDNESCEEERKSGKFGRFQRRLSDFKSGDLRT